MGDKRRLRLGADMLEFPIFEYSNAEPLYSLGEMKQQQILHACQAKIK